MSTAPVSLWTLAVVVSLAARLGAQATTHPPYSSTARRLTGEALVGMTMWAGMPEWRDLQRRLLREQYANLPAAISTDERASVARMLVERRVKLETQEEALVLTAAGQGIERSRRPDADARIVLCVVLKD